MKKEIKPIFIMGAPRSGTTLLAGMLANTNKSIALPEMHYIHELLKEEILYFNVDKQRIAKKLQEHFMFRDLQIALELQSIRELVGNSIKETISNIINAYNKKYSHKNFNIWVEHTPHNHKYFETLLRHYKNATFIHIVRDGRAVYKSTKEVDWGYKDVVRGSMSWRESVEECLLLERLYPEKVLSVRYEDLVNNSQEILEKITEFANISFEKSMLISAGVIKPQFARYTKDLGSKANTKSVQKWKDNLKSYEIEHFSAYNRDLLEYFSYETQKYHPKYLTPRKYFFHKILGKIKSYYFNKKAKKRFNSIS